MFRAFTAALVLLFTPAAWAADGAQSMPLGFSKNGNHFAFMQYGQQDGSGFSYADVFILDVKADRWVPDSPVRVLIEDEEKPLGDALRQAEAKAAPLLEQFGISEPADTLVHQPATELVPDRRTAVFGRSYNSMASQDAMEALGTYEITVKDVALPTPANCFDTDIAMPVGLELTVTSRKTGAVITASKDKSIPASRNCAHAYDIEAVYAPSNYGLPMDYWVALIGVYSRGFEGSNRRFIAVPFEAFE